MAKRVGPALFAISIVDNLCVLHQNKSSTIKLPSPRLIINVPCVSNFMTVSWLFHQSQKKTVVVKRLHWPLGTRYSGRCRCRAGFKQESMYGLSAATIKKSRCGEVAVSGGSTVEMLFFNFILGLNNPLRFFWVFFFFFPKTIKHQHLKFSVAVRLTLERILTQDG